MAMEVDRRILRLRNHVHGRHELRLRAIVEDARRRKLRGHAAAGTDFGGARWAFFARLNRRRISASATSAAATLGRGFVSDGGRDDEREESDDGRAAHESSGGTWSRKSVDARKGMEGGRMPGPSSAIGKCAKRALTSSARVRQLDVDRTGPDVLQRRTIRHTQVNYAAPSSVTHFAAVSPTSASTS